MAKQKQKTWQAEVNGATRTFVLDIIPSGKQAGYTLIVDGTVKLTAPVKWLSAFAGYDLPFELDGRELRLIISQNNKNVDIVADGHYLSNGKKYVALPKWVWAFLALLVPLAVTGGALGAICGVAGFSICTAVAKSSLNTIVRVILCVVIMSLAWVVYSVLGVMLLLMLKRR